MNLQEQENEKEQENENELLHISFNQDSSCFAVGTNTGFRSYNCEPFKEVIRRDFRSGGGTCSSGGIGTGIGVVEMLFRCNYLALVGGGENPRYDPNQVMIWDNHQNRNIGELSFCSAVKAVKLRRDRIVVVLERKIHVYNFHNLKLIDTIETIQNLHGLCALCPTSNNTIIACPGPERGTIRVKTIYENDGRYDLRKNKVLVAHESDLACIALNLDGTRLATSSDKGTLIRVFDTSNYTMLQELRRGMDRARIHSITFNPSSQYVACSSDHGTVHVWALSTCSSETGGADAVRKENSRGDKKPASDENTKSSTTLSFVGNLVPSFLGNIVPSYFQSERSFAQFRTNVSHTLVAFGNEPNTIIIVGADGSFWKVSYEGGGECVETAYCKFAKSTKVEVKEVPASSSGALLVVAKLAVMTLNLVTP